MNPKTITKLQYFVGKVCSIFTGPINRQFDEVRSREHFVVEVQEIDHDALWGTHPYNGTVTFFPLESIKFITEEVVLDPSNPEHAQMIKEYQEKTGKMVMSDVSPHIAPVVEPPPQQLVQIGNISKETPAPKTEPAFVNVKHLQNLAQRTKKSFEIKELISP